MYRSNVLLIWAYPCWQRIYVCENHPPPIFQKKSIKVLETVCPQNIDLNQIFLWEKISMAPKKVNDWLRKEQLIEYDF